MNFTTDIQNARQPIVRLPLCTQEDFDKAVDTLKLCRVQTPCFGFEKPFFAPGGEYGSCWWSLDGALAVDGYKWIDPECETDLVYDLAAVQKQDGRIPLYGIDDFTHIPSVKVPIGSLPKFFETCHAAARRRASRALTQKVYDLTAKNLEWWFKNREDSATGLIYAVFEETFIPNTDHPCGEYCPIDTNIQVARGCMAAADLAGLLGYEKEARIYAQKARRIADAVYRYLWDEDKKAYYPYILSSKKHVGPLMVSAFLGLSLPGADRRRHLTDMLEDESLFNRKMHPLTTVAVTDPAFTTVEGPYNGNPSWSGSVWTLTNRAVIQSLFECGRADLAAELAADTVTEFKGQYTEFHHPINGAGHGVKDYAWTAAQFIQIITEDLLGICFDAAAGQLCLKPHIPARYDEFPWEIENLRLPDGGTLSMNVCRGTVKYSCDSSLKVQVLT